MAVYGYVRVSTKEQNEDRQLIALEECEFHIDRVFMDKLSGKDFNRPSYQRMIRALKRGDLVVVKSIDRLGRNYQEIIEQWKKITSGKKADIFVLDMPLLDTRQGKDLTGTLISDIVLQLLSYVAQTERENTKKRQAEGIAAAKLKGIRFGRPRRPAPEGYEQMKERWQRGEVSARGAARALGMSVDTFLRWSKQAEDRELLSILPEKTSKKR